VELSPLPLSLSDGWRQKLGWRRGHVVFIFLHTEKIMVLKWFFKKGLWFYEEPSPPEEAFIRWRHHI